MPGRMVSKEAAPDTGGTATRNLTLADLPTREYICATTSIIAIKATTVIRAISVIKAITGITGRAPTAYENHYAGDIRFPIRLLGVPAFGVGSIGGNFYGPDEWVDEDDLVRLAAVVIDTTRNWAALAS